MWIENERKDESKRISPKRKKITIMFKWFSFEWKLKKEEKHKKIPSRIEEKKFEGSRRKGWGELSRVARKKSEKNIIESRNNFPTLKPNRTHLFCYAIYSRFPHSPISAGFIFLLWMRGKIFHSRFPRKASDTQRELTIISSVFLLLLFLPFGFAFFLRG